MQIVIANQSGSKNRGCEALVRSILIGLKAHSSFNNSQIDLHTLDRDFDTWRFGNQIKYTKALCLMYGPAGYTALHTRRLWLNKILYRGLALAEQILLSRKPHLRDLSRAKSADLIICAGGDDLSVDYNGFYSHAAYLNLGTPTFLCGQSIGPFPKREEAYFKKSTKDVCLITARESHTYRYMKELGLSCPVEQTADVAFLLPTLSREQTLDYARRFFNVNLEGRKLAGLSASELITKYYKYGREEGVRQIAGFVDNLNEQGYSVVLIPHVMETVISNNDLVICSDILRQTKSPDANIALSGLFSCVDVKSIIGLCDVLIGARTHATIASMSQGIPTVAIAYSRKAYGIMEDYYGADLSKKLIVPADQVYTESLAEATKAALQAGRQPEAAQRMKTLAMKNFDLIGAMFSSSKLHKPRV